MTLNWVVEDLSWRSIYLIPRLCTLSTKIRNFQFKFLHRRIATNSFLSKIGILETALCYLWKTGKETLIHLFWEYSVTKTFWGRVHRLFVSIHLIQASHVLDIYECLGFSRRERGYFSKPLFAPRKGIIFIAVNLRTYLRLSENMRNSWNII